MPSRLKLEGSSIALNFVINVIVFQHELLDFIVLMSAVYILSNRMTKRSRYKQKIKDRTAGRGRHVALIKKERRRRKSVRLKLELIVEQED